MNILTRQIRFTASVKNKVFIGITLGLFLSFIIIFLEPFDTNEYTASYKNVILSGYGLLIFGIFLAQSLIENIWYYRIGKIWTIRNEIISTFFFFLITGTILYLYNRLVVNKLDYSIASHWWYYTHIVVLFIPVLSPLLLYLRNKFGERIPPTSESSIAITGENKAEILEIEKEELIYIKAVENYIEIFYFKPNKEVLSKTFRQTLSNVHQQLPFLEKCHRSYLLNIEAIKTITGNSQSAKISFKNFEEEIPLSKTFYKSIKDKFALLQ